MTKHVTKVFKVLFLVFSFGCLPAVACVGSVHAAPYETILGSAKLYDEFKKAFMGTFLEGKRYVRLGSGFTGSPTGSMASGTIDTATGFWGSLAIGHVSTRETPSLSEADRILKDITTQKRRNALAVLRVLQVLQVPHVEDITTLQNLLLHSNLLCKDNNCVEEVKPCRKAFFQDIVSVKEIRKRLNRIYKKENNSAEDVESHWKAFFEDIDITQKALLLLTDEVTNIAKLKELKIREVQEGQEGISGFQVELEVSYRFNNLSQTHETPTIGDIVTSIPTYGSLQQYSIMLNASYHLLDIDKYPLSPFIKIGAGPTIVTLSDVTVGPRSLFKRETVTIPITYQFGVGLTIDVCSCDYIDVDVGYQYLLADKIDFQTGQNALGVNITNHTGYFGVIYYF